MNRILPQKIAAFCKLRIKLIVQIIAVGQYNNRRRLHRRLQQMRIKHHRQRLAAALRMPENAALAVGFGGVLCGRSGLAHCKILMITGKNLDQLCAVIREANEIAQNIEQAFFLKDALEKCIELRKLRILIVAVNGFPFHEAIFAGSDRASSGCELIADNQDRVIYEHRRNLVHIIAELQIRLGCVGFLTRRRFQLHHDDRQTVQEQDHIGALFAVLDECPLIRGDERIVLRMLVIHKVDDRGALLALLRISRLYAVLQIVRKHGIFRAQLAVFNAAEPLQRVLNRIIGRAFVDAPEAFFQHLVIERGCEVALHIRPVKIVVVQLVLKQLYDRAFVGGFGVEGHFISSYSFRCSSVAALLNLYLKITNSSKTLNRYIVLEIRLSRSNLYFSCNGSRFLLMP